MLAPPRLQVANVLLGPDGRPPSTPRSSLTLVPGGAGGVGPGALGPMGAVGLAGQQQSLGMGGGVLQQLDGGCGEVDSFGTEVYGGNAEDASAMKLSGYSMPLVSVECADGFSQSAMVDFLGS